MLINLTTEQRTPEYQFRKLYPNTSFPAALTDAVLAEYDHAVLIRPETPEHLPTQKVVELADAFVNGVWTVQYEVVDFDEAEMQAYALKVKDQVQVSVQAHLDSKAVELGYDNMLSMSTYAFSTVPKFQAEGQAGIEWRDAVWTYCYGVLADVQAGIRPLPDPEDLILELPVFVPPVEQPPATP